MIQNLLEQPLTMSSRVIAELTAKEHSNVKRDIATMIIQLNYPNLPLKDCPVFHPSELKGHGITLGCFEHCGNVYDEFNLNHEYSLLLVSGYSVNLRHKIIKRWQELEEVVRAPQFRVPQTLGDALRLAADLDDKVRAQAAVIEHQRPAVEFVGRYVDSGATKSIREVAKTLGIPERRFIESLLTNGVLFRSVPGGPLMPYAVHQNKGYFCVKAGESNGHAFGQTRFTTEGIAWVAKRLGHIGAAQSENTKAIEMF